MQRWPGAVRFLSKWDRGPGRILLFPLTLLSYLYKFGVSLRIRLYRAGFFKTKRLGCSVISVGNLTVGGTGKTPLVDWIALTLKKEGERVVIISRGYKRKSGEKITVVSKGEGPLISWEEVGEEPYWLASRTRGIPVLVGKNRFQVGQYAIKQFNPTVILLDDGFQHLGLYRDLNLLLLDATAPFGNEKLLPRGVLREPISQMERASVVILTRVEQCEDLEKIVKVTQSRLKKKKIFLMGFQPGGFFHLGNGKQNPVDMIKGKKILALSGIGNPKSFHEHLKRLGPTQIIERVYPDHYHYFKEDLKEILLWKDKVDYIVTTEKDGVKLAPLLAQDSPIWAMSIDPQIHDEEELLKVLTEIG